ncbi:MULTISPECIES: hypothetical protein [Paraburkholderia]|uniref:hypothetical protein n=1 Tax=Paraburkholderia TaxID=1822464 RepID=UPI0038BA6759
MKHANKVRPMLPTLALLLAGCATGGMQTGTQTYFRATLCRVLTEIRNKAPATRERKISELAVLEQAGYHPNDVCAEQRLVISQLVASHLMRYGAYLKTIRVTRPYTTRATPYRFASPRIR